VSTADIVGASGKPSPVSLNHLSEKPNVVRIFSP
jgi:hypothetical protein